ncbi:uncharacterized protein LOC121272835 [Carcharodon carcharias]|uniref:uncharacterized protein LOC121272835 n=1 Tax=Carcharodon carcharias TaxID=13397 RepID=UPI001B7DC2FA|nr:uncharacterized protein LOC121272835 [Carcharodon carcharias]
MGGTQRNQSCKGLQDLCCSSLMWTIFGATGFFLFLSVTCNILCCARSYRKAKFTNRAGPCRMNPCNCSMRSSSSNTSNSSNTSCSSGAHMLQAQFSIEKSHHAAVSLRFAYDGTEVIQFNYTTNQFMATEPLAKSFAEQLNSDQKKVRRYIRYGSFANLVSDVVLRAAHQLITPKMKSWPTYGYVTGIVFMIFGIIALAGGISRWRGLHACGSQPEPNQSQVNTHSDAYSSNTDLGVWTQGEANHLYVESERTPSPIPN